MGEPGTKEVLSLDELEAAVGTRSGRKHVLSILAENKPGVLARIAGLFARRGFNIDSLAVGPTEHDDVSRDAHLAAHAPGHDVVVAREDLDVDTQTGQLLQRGGARIFGWVEKGEEPEQDQV